MLEGSQIRLRLFEERDLDEFIRLENIYAEHGEHPDPRFFPLVTARKDFAEFGWWKEHEGRMLITDHADRMLGTIVFFQGMPHLLGYEIGYQLLRTADHGQGITTAALRIFSAYLFELKPIPRLQLCADTGNVASQRVAEKCGFRREGTLCHVGRTRGRLVDCHIYALLRADCPSLADALAR
jgi:ribosomal-protein-alanine N-acetyltransferase